MGNFMKSFLPTKLISHLPLVKAKSVHDALYTDANDRVKHLQNMERLAEEIDRSVLEIKPIYEEVLALMKIKARIHDYLPILVSKRVKYLLTN
jgi:hypothetical protein